MRRWEDMGLTPPGEHLDTFLDILMQHPSGPDREAMIVGLIGEYLDRGDAELGFAVRQILAARSVLETPRPAGRIRTQQLAKVIPFPIR